MIRRLTMMVVFLSLTAFAQSVEDGGVEAPLLPPPPVAAPVAAPAPAAAPAAAVPPVKVSAGFGEGFTVKTGEFLFTVHGLLQAQALFVAPEARTTQATRLNEIMARRARLTFRGDGPYKLTFSLQMGFTAGDLETDAPNPLLDAWVQWAGLRDLSVRVGQMRVPFNGQRNVTAFNLQMVDRSTASLEYSLDRDVGLLLFSDDFLGLGDRLRYFVGIYGGDGRNRVVANNGMLYVARIRVSPFGKFDDREEGDPSRSPKFRMSFGGAVARNVGTNRPRSTTGTPYKLGVFDYSHATGDLQMKWYGASLLAEFYWRHADQPDHTGTVSGAALTEYARSGWGYLIQGGYYVLPWLEVAGRFGDVRPDGTIPGFPRVREAGGGLNFMLQKHDLKLQADYLYMDDGTGQQARHQVRVQATVYF